LRSLESVVSAEPKGGNVRTFTLDGGTSAATLAQALQRLLQQMRPNPVKVVLPGKPGEGDAKPNPGKKGAPGGKGPAEVTLTAVGNKLVVESADPEVLRLVSEMVRLLSEAAASDFEVIRLKHARATEAARVLDEVFNGAKPGKENPKGGVRLERVRVVADPSSNALIVRASSLDLLTIRNLLEQHLDVAGGERPKKSGKEKKGAE
jgi:hypothetical protein